MRLLQPLSRSPLLSVFVGLLVLCVGILLLICISDRSSSLLKMSIPFEQRSLAIQKMSSTGTSDSLEKAIPETSSTAASNPLEKAIQDLRSISTRSLLGKAIQNVSSIAARNSVEVDRFEKVHVLETTTSAAVDLSQLNHKKNSPDQDRFHILSESNNVDERGKSSPDQGRLHIPENNNVAERGKNSPDQDRLHILSKGNNVDERGKSSPDQDRLHIPERNSVDERGKSLSVQDRVHISESSDVDERGKWQMEQVEEFCKRHNRTSEEFVMPNSSGRTNLFRHLIFDDRRKFIFCFIPKIGCTFMRRALFAMQGAIPKETVNWLHVDENRYLVPGIMKASFLRKTLSDATRVFRVRNYWKFIFIRNPLERLLSAYLNKMSKKPLVLQNTTYDEFEKTQQKIMQHYHPSVLKKWKEGIITDLRVDFETYLRWIIDTPNGHLNEHFAPIIEMAQPCRVKYNFYGNFKVFGSDLNSTIDKLNLPRNMFTTRGSYHSPGTETKDKLREYYSTVRHEVKERLLVDFSEELDFYYTLYPEEAGSHTDFM